MLGARLGARDAPRTAAAEGTTLIATEFPPDILRRIERTTAIRDTDRIPKVERAGDTSVRDGVRVQTMHCGVLVEQDCYYGPWMTEVIRRLRGHHEPQEEVVFHELLTRLAADTPAPVMVELGSYWAYYSLWFKNAYPDARCLLVEPDPSNLRVGQRNFALNSVDGRFIQAAVGATHGGHTRLRSERGEILRNVARVSVDGLLADEGIPRIDVLLCDVQGAELEVLRGARDALRERRIRFLCVSTHMSPGDPTLHQRCLAQLEGLGAQIVAEHSIPESCSVDGLIVASLDPRDQGWTVEITIGRARDSIGGELEWRLARTRGWRGLARLLVGQLIRNPAVRARAARVVELIDPARALFARQLSRSRRRHG
jgi:FkbM family methyltransferase